MDSARGQESNCIVSTWGRGIRKQRCGVIGVSECERHISGLVEVSYWAVMGCYRCDFGRKCIPEEEG